MNSKVKEGFGATQKSLWLSAEIKKRYGNVTRSRGCYLYTEKGVRLTDCYLDNGKAIFGWDGGKARTVFKNLLERGATGCYDSGYSLGLENAVKKLLPVEYTVIRWWQNLPSCFSCCMDSSSNSEISNEFDFSDAPDFTEAAMLDGAPDIDSIKPVLWRPWINICGEAELQPTGYNKVKIYHDATGNGNYR